LRASGNAGLFVATGTFRSTQNMAQTTLSLLATSLGLSGAAVGALAAGANLLSVLIMVLVTARLATTSARTAVFAGLVLMTASVVSFLVPARATLIIGTALLGIAGGLVLPSVATAVGDRASAGPNGSRAARARALAMMSVVLAASLALGPAYESLILSVAHEQLVWAYVAFLPVVVIGVAVARGRRPSSPAAPADSTSLRASLAGLGSLFRNRRWVLALCGQAVYMVPFSLVIVFTGLLGRTLYHASASMVELGIALFFVTSFACRATLTRRPAIAHRVRLFALCIAATLCGIALLALGHSLAPFLVALAILGAPHGLCYPLALGLVSDAVELADLARANAGFQAVSSLINVIAPLVFGLVLDHLGDRAVLISAAIPMVPLAVLLWAFRDAG